MESRSGELGFISLLVRYLPLANGAKPDVVRTHRDERYKEPKCDRGQMRSVRQHGDGLTAQTTFGTSH